MGYNTTVSGKIRITPPLAWGEIKGSPFLSDDDMSVRLDVEVETVDTPDGELLRRTAYELIPATDEAFKAYHLIEHVQQAIDAFPGHNFTGRLHCEGEEAGDLWRVVIRDGRAAEVRPQIVWPDED